MTTHRTGWFQFILLSNLFLFSNVEQKEVILPTIYLWIFSLPTLFSAEICFLSQSCNSHNCISIQIGVTKSISRVDMKRGHNLCWPEYTMQEMWKAEQEKRISKRKGGRRRSEAEREVCWWWETWWEDKVLVATRAPYNGKLLNQHRQDVITRAMLPQEDPLNWTRKCCFRDSRIVAWFHLMQTIAYQLNS